VVNPRRDFTAAYAEKNGGIHLQLTPGTDTMLNNAIARVIIENGWEDIDFIAERTADSDELAQESGWRRKMFGMTVDDYKNFLLGDDTYSVENAERITGVPANKIRRAAEILARPLSGGTRPKTSMMIEKGNYWSHNYPNTASFSALGLLVGAGGRPGQMISRAGGHQRGMISGAGYPKDKSPDEYKGNKIELNVDRWVVEGNVRFMWLIGSTWAAAMGASQFLRNNINRLVTETGPTLTRSNSFDGNTLNVERVKDTLKAKVDAMGMVLIQQDIYANAMSEFADLILPAATWGEVDFTRMQAERRLRMYSQIMPPPGEAKPDWWIIAQVAKRMGFEGYDWKEPNDVFEEAADRSVGTVHDYKELVNMARSKGVKAHEFLRDLGTTGIQCPINLENGQLTGTKHLHQDSFKTASGKAVFPRGDWDDVREFQDSESPKGDELWVTNMLTNEH
jgi:arsenite oxidase large subunit